MASDASEPTPAGPDSTRDRPETAPETAERIARLKTASYYFDDAIRVPGTRYRVGVDPMLGLLPVVGDAPGVALSAYIVAEAVALDVPRETVARMVLNVLVDAVVGSIPVVGDLFDAAWKANARNVALLETRHAAPASSRRDRAVLLAVFAALLAGVAAVGAGVGLLAWVVLSRVGVALPA